ncbi:MAG: GerAB/ArcD/ProY family transporter [Bacillota bacterium]
MKEVRISPGQAALLLFILIWPRYLLLVPSLVAEMAEQDAWVANLMGGFNGVAVVLLLLAVASLAPGKDLIEAAEEGLGKAGGKLLGTLLLAVFLFMTYTTLRASSAFIKETFLRVTPLWANMVLLVTQGIGGAFYGTEPVARAGGITVALLVAGLIPSVALLVGQFDPRLLFPVFARGPLPALRGAPISAFPFGEVVALGMLLPALGGTRRSGPLLAGLLITWVVTGGLLAVDQGILGWYNLSRIPFSFLEGLRVVRVPPLLERIEVAVATIWMLVSFAKIALLFIVQARAAGCILGLGDHRPLIPLLAALTAVFALNVPSQRTVYSRVLFWGGIVSAALQTLLPAVVVLGLLWRRRQVTGSARSGHTPRSTGRRHASPVRARRARP